MNPLNIILTILLFLSGVLTVILVLMHSGKGTGVSDMIAPLSTTPVPALASSRRTWTA